MWKELGSELGFGAKQGREWDDAAKTRRLKIRSIDDYSESLGNATLQQVDKLNLISVDSLWCVPLFSATSTTLGWRLKGGEKDAAFDVCFKVLGVIVDPN